MRVLAPYTRRGCSYMAGEAAYQWRMPCGDDGGQEMGLALLFSSLQRSQAVNARPCRAGCLPGWNSAWQREGTRAQLHTLPGQASLQKYLLKKYSSTPRKTGLGAQPAPGLQTEGGGERHGGNAAAGRSQARPPAPLAAGTAQHLAQRVRGRDSSWAR